MSDLEDFFDDDIDVAAFDAVLNAATSNPAPTRQKQQQHQQQPAASSSTIDDCFDDDIDAAAFDAVVNAATSMPPPTSTTSRHQQPENSHTQGNQQKKYIQPTIFGASQVPPKPGRQNKQQPSTSSQYQQPAASKKTQQEPKVKAVKKWDTLSAIKVLPDIMQAGKKQRKNKSKFAAMDDDDDDEEEEMMMMMDEEEELDSDTDLLAKALQEESSHKKIPMKLQSDDQAIKTWVYSINKPKRKYQYDIVARALYNNCLVSLPTGLGKTFIAAVVMLKCEIHFLTTHHPLR
jgi:ATP-dependent DNA helicase MPH1